MKISVIQDDIDKALVAREDIHYNCSRQCPIAQATNRQGLTVAIDGTFAYVFVDLKGGIMVCNTCCPLNEEKTFCVLSNRELNQDTLVITPEGPMSTELWGDTEVDWNKYGEAIIPSHLRILAEVIWKRKVDCGYDED